MIASQTILRHYRLTEQEILALKKLQPLVEPVTQRLTDNFYEFLGTIPEIAKFLQDEARLQRLRQYHQRWVLGLFTGPFDDHYFIRLQRIGYTHVQVGLPAHYVSVAMNYIRIWLEKLIEAETNPEDQPEALEALNKILDINLDVITRTYHEEELRRVIVSFHWDQTVIRFAQRFTSGLSLILVIGLLGLSFGAIALIVKDVINMFTGEFAKGLVSTMGSLLVLWLVIELLESEIDRLKGGAFRLNLFVGVGLVAFIREVLVLSLSPKDIVLEGVILAGILVLGFVYWLLAKVEDR
jgi:uncharacterized membrane protein (DUF373 family)